MKTRARSRGRSRAGFSLLEMTISAALLLMLTGTLVEAMNALRGTTTASGDRAGLQTQGDRTLLRVIDDLRRSGTITVGPKTYPYVFDGGVPDDPLFGLHAHPPAQENASPGDPDFGPDREIVVLLPRDQDGDRRPDLDGEGQLVWDANETSYVVVTRADGINCLEQRVNGGNPRVYGRHVERVLFDDAQSSGFQIPLGSVRVRLFFRRRDGEGNLIRYANEAVIRPRNG